jgi:3-methylcrotonyl-CoA carboxylase alpha subunit
MNNRKGRSATKKKALPHHKIQKLLIANRGEIALRIKQACEKAGIAAVGICSAADQNQSFIHAFNEHVLLPGQAASETYLNIEKIIAAALQTGCDAVHPGYGFLSENASFAQAVVDAGLTWVGPQPHVIELLGSKTSARALAKRCRVPIVPGTKGALSDDALIREAKKMKCPLLIKATAGGGGRGMRIVRDHASLPAELARARAEASKFFSDPDVFIERYIEAPRHVEVQLFGDAQGHVVHFGTRDCSAQRRYQKIIEEAPAPFLATALRRRIEKAAVTIAKAARYQNAGTAEFIVKGNEFFFLEINTRIQVEHPVTEHAYDVDLVDLQLAVAQGVPIPKRLQQAEPTRYAVECRIYAESIPGFMPSLGTIERLSFPEVSSDVRIDFGFQAGDAVTPYYDAMIGKLIFTGTNRLATLDRATAYLAAVEVAGIDTNLSFLQSLMQHRGFRQGTLSIQTIDAALNDFEASFPPVEHATYHLQPLPSPTVIKIRKETYTVTVEPYGDDYIATARASRGKRNAVICKSRHAATAVAHLRAQLGQGRTGRAFAEKANKPRASK